MNSVRFGKSQEFYQLSITGLEPVNQASTADRLKAWVAGSSPAQEMSYGHSGMAEFRQGFLNPVGSVA
jgi:hypothetical protein